MSGEQRGLVYLVTGGCGFLGKHLLRVLLEHEREKLAEVRVFDKNPDHSMEEQSTEHTKVVVIQGDVTDYSCVLEASRGVDVFIHAASLVDVWHKIPESLIHKVNVTGTENVIQACVENGIPSLLFTSSMEVIGPNKHGDHFVRGNEDTPYRIYSTMPYPKSKIKSEELVLKANGIQVKGGQTLVTCALRPTAIYGEDSELIKDYWEQCSRRNGVLLGGIPDKIELSRVYAGNVAWMHLLAARALRDKPESVSGEAFFCYDDSPYKNFDDFNMQFFTPHNIKLVRVPFLVLWFIAFMNDLLRWLLSPFYSFTPLLNKFTLAAACTSFTVKTDKAHRHFQYEPLYSWEQCRSRTQRFVDSLAQNHCKGA